jgi:hypothetical protein
MTLPAHQTDVWSKATQDDKIKALVLLSGMPAQATDEAGIDKAAYYLALENVTRFGLAEAVKAILQGQLGHAFFPSPPELRIQCDRAMEHHKQMRERIARQERIASERLPDIPPRTADEIARHKERMARFYEASGYEDGQKIAQERVTLDPALVAQIADAPTTWKRTA